MVKPGHIIVAIFRIISQKAELKVFNIRAVKVVRNRRIFITSITKWNTKGCKVEYLDAALGIGIEINYILSALVGCKGCKAAGCKKVI